MGRKLGVVGYALSNDDVKAELIVDGVHVAPAVVNLTFKIKGANGIELITDSMRAKGMKNGQYDLGGQDVFVKDGQARLENGDLAGSVLTYDKATRNMMEFTGASISDIVMMTSTNQIYEFGLTEENANFNLVDENLNIIDNYILGIGNS
jgi:N-acetylglucosamine-6-phosphate deacetylase